MDTENVEEVDKAALELENVEYCTCYSCCATAPVHPPKTNFLQCEKTKTKVIGRALKKGLLDSKEGAVVFIAGCFLHSTFLPTDVLKNTTCTGTK